MTIDEAKRRILETQLFGPALKSQLVLELPGLEGERLDWLMIMIDRAEEAYKNFGETSEAYRRILCEIETAAVRAAEREADDIFSELEAELTELES